MVISDYVKMYASKKAAKKPTPDQMTHGSAKFLLGLKLNLVMMNFNIFLLQNNPFPDIKTFKIKNHENFRIVLDLKKKKNVMAKNLLFFYSRSN